MAAAIFAALLLGVLMCLGGCNTQEETPAGAIVGRAALYDYSPSIIQVGHVQQFWWCGEGENPAQPGHQTDTIQYQLIDLDTGHKTRPQLVLAETPGAWDSAYTCGPQVIRGIFTNPLQDGQTYSYAMYYEATAQVNGLNNSIGVAFSNDGIQWKKYPLPIVQTTYKQGYGPSQPAAYNSDGKQAIWLFYEDDEPPLALDSHVQAVSSDGVHFTNLGTLTTKGLSIPSTLASWGNMAFNQADGSWYASFNLPTRSLVTTGNIEERGSYGFQVYKILQNDLLVGKTGWQQLKTIDTSLTGYQTLFDAGFARDPYGNINQDGTGRLQVFPSFANSAVAWNASAAGATMQADVTSWDIGQYTWSLTESPLYELKRYNNSIAHQVTTGWIDPKGNFLLEKTLGKVYQYPQRGATTALYSCKNGTIDTFVSLDVDCEGYRRIGIIGYAYPQRVEGLGLSALYRCSTGHDHFASSDPLCEGSQTDQQLAYILAE